jgi:pyruvate decarboxylase
LPKLCDRIALTKIEPPLSLTAPALEVPTPTKDITQSFIWHRLAAFCRPGDILIAESGTAQFGFPDVRLPPKVSYLTQVYFGSIGYSVGACLGAAIAAKEKKLDGRVILVVGDGSLQLTAQEIGSMIRLGLENIKV